MMRAVWALLPLLLWACGPSTLPAPSIESVEPQQVAAGITSVLSVKVSAVLPLSVSYEDESADPAQLAMTVRLGGQEVDIPFSDRDGMLFVPVPEGMVLGDYDVRVVLADGREAVRERAFSVVPASTTPTGPGGDRGMQGMGFQIDPIGDQVRNSPFKITLRALGPRARSFQEPVSLRASKGKVVSKTLGSFSDGVRVEEIALTHPGNSVYLLVEDTGGHKGLSNPFRVRSH
jgi:hypothetical protein